VTQNNTQNNLLRTFSLGCLALALTATGCQKKTAAAAGGGPQGLPVQTATVAMAPVAESSEYVATIKSRRSATISPQVSGVLTAIRVTSGQHVGEGQVLMTIDPRQQQAAVDSQRATERQKKAVYDYNKIELDRQQKLFDAGVTSRDAFDQAQQAFDNSKADYESAQQLTRNQESLLAYYTIRAPFAGIVGDIPVHVGDYVSQQSAPATLLTTVDEMKNLEAYVYVPAERSSQVRMGLGIELVDNSGKLLEKTTVDFVSPEVDSTTQGILVKAAVHTAPDVLRTAQLIKARIIWGTASMATVPVLAVTRQGGQTFVYVAEAQGGKYFAKQTPITLGDTVGNDYAVLNGLKNGDKVIVSGMQFLVDGMPVMPLPPGPAGPPASAGN
jgi:RND family efflux transporter MFP subunit